MERTDTPHGKESHPDCPSDATEQGEFTLTPPRKTASVPAAGMKVSAIVHSPGTVELVAITESPPPYTTSDDTLQEAKLEINRIQSELPSLSGSFSMYTGVGAPAIGHGGGSDDESTSSNSSGSPPGSPGYQTFRSTVASTGNMRFLKRGGHLARRNREGTTGTRDAGPANHTNAPAVQGGSGGTA